MKIIIYVVLALLLAGSTTWAQPGDRFIEGSEAWETLEPERATLMLHFQNYSPKPRFQIVRHRSGASTILVYFPGAGPSPALFGITPDNAISWRNYDPLPAKHVYMPRIAADDTGKTLVVWHDTKPRGIHGKLFDELGKTVWTEQVFSLPWNDNVDERDHLKRINILFWPDHGWIVAHSTFRHAIVQLFDLEGQKIWKNGASLSSKPNADNPISLIQDSPDSIFVLWYEHGFMKKPQTHSVFRAQRIDANGHFIWPKAIEVGEAPDFAMTIPREIRLSQLPDDKIKADLYRGMAGDAIWQITEYSAIINASGMVQTEGISSD